jgi:hypothetical protein
MSLSGDSRAEFCPERIDLFSQLRDVSGVVQDHVSHPSALFPTGLCGDPGLGFSAREPVARHQPLDLSFMISVDGHDKIEFLLLAGLDQQWNDVHHNCGSAGSAFELGGPSPNGRVHNLLEIATRQRISEDNLGKPCSVELPVLDYIRTKTVDDRGKRRSARLDYLTGQYVGVDNDRPPGGKLGSHQAFPGRDATGQTYPHHCQQRVKAQWTCGRGSAAAGQLLAKRLQSLVGGK